MPESEQQGEADTPPLATLDAPPADTPPIWPDLRPAFGLLVALTLLTGAVYPLAVYGLANLGFPHQAHGSLVAVDGRIIGSALIGQSFTAPRYFWGRPSATTPAHNAANSTGSNLGPLNPALRPATATRVAALRAVDPGNRAPVPIDLVTASGSGIDPDISIAAARYQSPRVARRRGLPAGAVDALIDRLASLGQFAVLGAPRVNVLALNAALDDLGREHAPPPAGGKR